MQYYIDHSLPNYIAVGDRMGDVTVRQYSDADLASELRTHRSTSASHQVICAPYTMANQSMDSRRQTCVSHSTFEAEIVAADLALKTELLPALLPLWEVLLQRRVKCRLMEDVQAACKVIQAGGPVKLMHLPRARRIYAAATPEQFTRGVVDWQRERAQNEAADVGTKRFTDTLAWVTVLDLVNIVTPKCWKVNRYQDYLAS
eukprot:9151779-Pyramimonas_sp.AAC.1